MIVIKCGYMPAIVISFTKSLNGQCNLLKRIFLPGYNELTMKKDKLTQALFFVPARR